jgi:hypothetical protein
MLLGRSEDWSCRVSSVRAVEFQFLLKGLKAANMVTKYIVPVADIFLQPTEFKLLRIFLLFKGLNGANPQEVEVGHQYHQQQF